MTVELHLPDLPEVPISVGAPRRVERRRRPWHQRVRESLSSYLPLLLMALLALGTSWLVRNTPGAPSVREDANRRQEPDYTMRRFSVERFDAGGRLKVRIEGETMRHYPATNRIEIDDARIRAFAPDGRVTVALARRALSNGDGSEVQLLGGAQVDSIDGVGAPIQMRSEFLHAFLASERFYSHLPVTVVRGSSRVHADGLAYDHLARLVEFKGRTRALFSAPAARAARTSAPPPKP